MDVSQPKLHNCSGSKFVDYEITIEVGFANPKYFTFFHGISRAFEKLLKSGRAYSWQSTGYFPFFSNRPIIRHSIENTPL